MIGRNIGLINGWFAVANLVCFACIGWPINAAIGIGCALCFAWSLVKPESGE